MRRLTETTPANRTTTFLHRPLEKTSTGRSQYKGRAPPTPANPITTSSHRPLEETSTGGSPYEGQTELAHPTKPSLHINEATFSAGPAGHAALDGSQVEESIALFM